jgi:PAS domain S-box-containing protein
VPPSERSDESAHRWRAIVASAVDGIVVIDARGHIEAFNPAAERLFGYQEGEVLGRNVAMLMPSPHHEEHDAFLSQYLRTGKHQVIGIGREVAGRRKDGTTFPLHLSVGEMSIQGERKFTGILHDLSDRVALEERLRSSEARWRSVVESAVDGIIVIDAQGRVEAFNPAAVRLFGYAESEVIGQNVSMLMPSPYREEHHAYLSRYLRTGEQRIIGIGREVTGLRKDGTTLPLHLSVGEMSLGGVRKFTGILHDLSGRVAMEAQLREQTALARLGEMAAVIAHEVKNPLAGVRGAIQIIGGRLPAEAADADVLKEIVTRIDELTELINDLLLFARPPRPRFALLDVGPLIATTAELLQGDQSFADVQVRIEGSAPQIMADPGLLKIVFSNLMVNGAQAMHNRGTIQISLSGTNGACAVVIRDEGPGIPIDIREKIFTPFFTTKSRGTGLGLPTARRIVEAHEGSIAVECPVEGGTAVTVRLPAITRSDDSVTR